MRVAIIGGGAAGLFAGGLLSNDSIDTTIFDGNEKLGKKLYITGKGRCNLTNDTDVDGYLANVVHGKKFMYSAINNFTCADTIKFFENQGLPLKTERGNRVFPRSDKSSDVIKTLSHYAAGCKINLCEKVLAVTNENGTFKIKTEKQSYLFDKVIVATGGKSYPATGSSGDGYKLAASFGHNIVKPCPALVPIKIGDSFCSSLEGLSLKNVTLTAVIAGKKHSLFGEMLFTHDGISGPIALSLSSFIGREQDVKLYIDFKSALTNEQLHNRLIRDFQDNSNKNLSYIIKGLLPKRLAEVFLTSCGIDGSIKAGIVSAEQRKIIVEKLKSFELNFNGLYPIEAGIITSGGVCTKEINPKTMESKLISGLYFIGEVLDVDCLTGGFNLQTAFSTAHACAQSIISTKLV